MIIISLKDFILTGKFGQISTGMTTSEVIDYLGNPGESAEFGSGTGELFYNGFEFFYWTEDNKIYTIQNDSLGNLLSEGVEYEVNDTVIVDTSFLQIGQALTFKNVTDYLMRGNIEFSTVNRGKYDEIRFLSGVTFDFEDEGPAPDKNDRSKLKLNGIRYQDYS